MISLVEQKITDARTKKDDGLGPKTGDGLGPKDDGLGPKTKKDDGLGPKDDGLGPKTKKDDGLGPKKKKEDGLGPSTDTGGGGGTSFTDTTITADELKAGGKTVKKGMKGDIVGKIQDLLIKLGYKNVSKNNTTDKVFGDLTEKMVIKFQSLNGLEETGVVGKATFGKLNSEDAIQIGGSSGKAQVRKDGEEVAGSDAVIFQETLKKNLRENLLKYSKNIL